jgi:hypothetical protein
MQYRIIAKTVIKTIRTEAPVNYQTTKGGKAYGKSIIDRI